MALLNPFHLKTLVAIGDLNKRKRFVCSAAGFLIGFIARNSKDPTKKKYYIFLVTNRHVFEGKGNVYLRFNKHDGKTEIFQQGLFFPNNDPRWLAHLNKKVDLALLNVSPQILSQKNIDYLFFNEEIFAYQKDFSKIGISIGDEVYILGFPMGIAGGIQNIPYVKGGIISRVDKELLRISKAFLIDSSIFPGNSGGPVVLKPTNTALANTKAVSTIYLLGVISGYLYYQEELWTHQTNPPTVVGLERENSGLSYVVPIDFMHQIFMNWKASQKKLEKAQKPKTPPQPQEEIKTSL